MSAAEVIEMIKRLPPEDQAAVRAFIENSSSAGPERKVAGDAEFARAAKRVMAENHELLRRLAQ